MYNCENVNIEKIKSIIREKGLKIKAVCKDLGFYETYFSNIKNRQDRMTEERLIRLAEYLGVAPGYLTDETDDPALIIGEPIPKSDLEKLQDMTIDMVRQLDDLQKLKMVYAALAASQKPKE